MNYCCETLHVLYERFPRSACVKGLSQQIETILIPEEIAATFALLKYHYVN